MKQLYLDEDEKKEVTRKFADRKRLYLEWKEQQEEVRKLASTLKFTIQEIGYALREYHGSIGEAAKFLGITRTVLYRKIQETPSLLRLMRDIEKENTDTIEYNLIDQAKEGSLPAIMFYLKTKGAGRGYGDALKVDSSEIGDAATLIQMLQANMKKQVEDKSKEITVEWQVKEES